MPPRGVKKGSKRARQYEDQLYEEARRKGVKGRSKMTKAELARAVGGRR
ncbi:MAG: hypothetical protein M5U27_14935 [Gaiella sp.]|nr:hypothetical protein [Gaiella sp.]